MSKGNISDSEIFTALFKTAHSKCFGLNFEQVPSEPDFKNLSQEIEEKTGLIIGWKSLKNYASNILYGSKRMINPSTATLDTLSRYVLDAPSITEIKRKEDVNPYRYWYKYRMQYLQSNVKSEAQSKLLWLKYCIIVLIVFASFYIIAFSNSKNFAVKEFFKETSGDYLQKNGWFLLSENKQFWNRRNEKSDHLTLFTLKGDSWPTKQNPPDVQNLLYRESFEDNFSTEIHFSDFIPYQNWQQAGIILMEDNLFKGKYIRISLAYNDYFGGLAQPGEIYIQVVASNGHEFQNPEEVIHYSIFKMDSTSKKSIVESNLKYSALKIEKKGENYRFLYAASSFDNFSFQEIGNYSFDMKLKHTGLFAHSGFVNSDIIPVSINYFKSESLNTK